MGLNPRISGRFCQVGESRVRFDLYDGDDGQWVGRSNTLVTTTVDDDLQSRCVQDISTDFSVSRITAFHIHAKFTRILV